MNQPDLFMAPSVPVSPSLGPASPRGPEPPFSRARRSDPRSSHDAAAQVERNGVAGFQATQVLAAVSLWPNSTSHELADVAHMDRYAIARRLPELAAQGLVRRVDPHADTVACRVSGKRVCRWEPIWR
jgi:hypothetical protein